MINQLEEVLEGKEIECEKLMDEKRKYIYKEQDTIKNFKNNGNQVNKIIRVDNIDNIMKAASHSRSGS